MNQPMIDTFALGTVESAMIARQIIDFAHK